MTLTAEVHLLVLCLTGTEQDIGIPLLFPGSCKGKERRLKDLCHANMFIHHVEFFHWNRH